MDSCKREDFVVLFIYCLLLREAVMPLRKKAVESQQQALPRKTRVCSRLHWWVAQPPCLDASRIDSLHFCLRKRQTSGFWWDARFLHLLVNDNAKITGGQRPHGPGCQAPLHTPHGHPLGLRWQLRCAKHSCCLLMKARFFTAVTYIPYHSFLLLNILII